MAELRTDKGRNRRVWLYWPPLAIVLFLELFVGAAQPVLGQVGPQLTGFPPAAQQNGPPPANPVGPPPADSLAAASPAEKVVDVRIAGHRHLSESKIKSFIHTRAGRPFDLDMINEDKRRLLHSGLFVDVDPRWQQVAGGRIVVFNLVERPLLTEVLFIGCKEIRKRTLQKESKLKAGDPADPMAIEQARCTIEEYYHEHGFNNAHVTLLEGGKTEDRRAIFLINEGIKQQVWNTTFIGNKIADNGRLRTQLTTSRPFLWLFGGEFDRKKVDEDVQRLTAYYRGLGFFRARIGHQVDFNEKNNWVTITYVIDEGPRFKVRNVSVNGNTKYTSEALTAELKLKGGDYFNQAKMAADKSMLVDKYGGIGYVFADIKPDPRFLEEPAQLDLVYNITEGDRFRVGKINVVIKGEYPHTQLTTVLNRLSLKPGDIIDIREIRASERRLRASQLFEANPATGSVPKIAFYPPGQEKKDDEEEIAEKPEKRHSSGGRGMGGRGMGGGGMGGSSGDDANTTFRGQSPDSPSGDRTIDLTLDCGRYVGPMDGSEVRDQGAEVRGQGSGNYQVSEESLRNARPLSNARPLQWAGASTTTLQSTAAAPADDPLWQKADALTAAMAQKKIDRSRLIPTQYYSANSGQVNPASQPSAQWTGSTATSAPAGQQPAAAPAYGQPNANQPASTQSNPNQAVPAQPAPAYGQQMWPNNNAPMRPADSPEGPYDPGPIFSQNSPFMGGPPDGGEPARLLPLDINTQEAMTGRIMVGIGVNSEAGVVGSVVLDEQNFDWTRWPTSWEEVRNGTAWRGAGERLRIEAAPGIASTSTSSSVSRYMITFQEPYLFNTQVSLGLSAYYYNRQFTEYTDTRVGGRIALGYQFTPDLSGAIAYRGAKINITNPEDPYLPALAEVVGRDLYLNGFQVSLTHDKRDNAYMATEGHLIEASFEEVIGSYQYPHAEIDLRKYFTLHERPDGSGRNVLSLAARAGFTGDNTPIYERYYAGGFSSLRGFQFRGVSPTEIGPSTGYSIAVGGDFLLLASAEYMFPITADDMLRAVVFCDTGTVEPTASNWTNQYRVAPGFGLRISVPAMGPAPIALDFAFPISWQAGDKQEVFSFFVGIGR